MNRVSYNAIYIGVYYMHVIMNETYVTIYLLLVRA